MSWELKQPKDEYYVPVITIKWIFLLHVGLTAMILLLGAIGWHLSSHL